MSNRLTARRLIFAVTALSVATATLAEQSEFDEIVVTARKIEERVQDIPMSMQVLSGQYLDEADMSHLFELQFNVPGLVVNNVGAYGAGFSLRGISDQGGSDLSVATHMNGVALGTSNMAISRLFDLDRIEVLKGPQGTLYGRNSTGGSINFITRAAEHSFSSEVELAYGSFDTARMQGYLNLPSDTADLRIAFIGSEGDGYIRNSVDNRRFAEDDFWGLRVSLRAETRSGLNLNLMAQRVADDGASGELWLPNPEYLPDPSDLHLTTVTLADPFLKTQNDALTVDLEHDFGIVTLHSITGYVRSEVDDKDDCAGLPNLLGCVRKIGPDKRSQWSQEFQLASLADAGVDWLAGAYFFDSDASTYYYLLTPATSPDPQNSEYSTTDRTAFAVFGQATWQLSERWSTTGGLRLSREEHRVSNVGTGRQDNPALTVAKYNWDHPSWRIDLEYADTEDLLVYAGISTGFKSGGITIDKLPNGDLDDYEPEELIAYEAGIKSQWLQRRLTLNAAAFFYDFKDLQVRTVVVEGGDIYVATNNAAKAEIYGIDAAGTFSASDQLTLSGSLVWLPKRDFVEYINDLTGDTLSGNKLSRVPESTVTAAINYTYPFRGRGDLSARIEYNYRSGFFYTKENMPMFSQDGFGLLNVFLDYEPPRKTWHLFASGRNLTDEDYFTQVFIQSSPGYPATYELGFGLRF